MPENNYWVSVLGIEESSRSILEEVESCGFQLRSCESKSELFDFLESHHRRTVLMVMDQHLGGDDVYSTSVCS